MTLEFVYWTTLAVGLGLLILSLLIGDVLGLFDIDLAGTDLAAGPAFFAAVTAFGAGGLLGLRGFGWGASGSVGLGIGTGVFFGAASLGLFVLLRKQEGESAFDLRGLIGERARVTLAIGPGRVGQVSVTHAGMTRAFSAGGSADLAVGEEVVVRDVIGSQLVVAPPAESPGQG